MIKKAITIFLLFFLSGCGTSHRIKAAEINNYMLTDNYKEIIKRTSKTSIAEKIEIENLNILDSLNTGNALFLMGKYETSVLSFDYADKQIENFINASMLTSKTKDTVSVINNQSIFDYEPMIMDNIYTSSYKILSLLALNDMTRARIEVNRAYTKQQYAAEFFSKQIEKANSEAQKQISALDTNNRKLWNSTKGETINKHFYDLSKWSGYRDYMNPFTTYLSGLFFIVNGKSSSDFENAATYMKRVMGMTDTNSFVKDDLVQAENLANFNIEGQEKNIWVIYENGMVADFEEIRIDIPAFIATNNISFISFSMPKPKLRSPAFSNLIIDAENKPVVKTEILADIDNIFIAEYNKRLPSIISKAVAQTIAKTVMQYVAQNNDKEQNGMLAFSALVYTLSTSNADLRSWHTLPKNVQIAKISAKNTDKISIFSDNMIMLEEIEINANRNTIVYIRIPSIISKPVISVITL